MTICVADYTSDNNKDVASVHPMDEDLSMGPRGGAPSILRPAQEKPDPDEVPEWTGPVRKRQKKAESREEGGVRMVSCFPTLAT
jgi:hypothetical protein